MILFAFIEKNTRQYLVKSDRKERHKLTLEFAMQSDTLPTLKPLNIEDSAFTYLLQTSINKDTLTYWLTDTLLWSKDTISVEMTYEKRDDSIYWQTDTINFVYREPRTNKKNQI